MISAPLTNQVQSAIISPNDEQSPHITEHVTIYRSEWLLIQQLRAVRKKSIGIIDIGGDGRPKNIRVIESCIVDLTH